MAVKADGLSEGSPLGRLSVRMGSPADARFASSLHAEAIPTGFLSSLGTGFLRRLYRRVTLCDDSFMLVAQSAERPIGFVAGSTSVASLYRKFLLRDGLVATTSAPLQLLRASRRALETLRHGRTSAPAGGGTELLAIAVDPLYRGRGAGRILVDAFCGELEERGERSAHVVVGEDNEPALRLYRSAGFDQARAYALHQGTQSLLLTWRSPQGKVGSAPEAARSEGSAPEASRSG